jgi:hypothetical protein
MSGAGESEADFAGELREFRIRLGEIRRIQTKCGDVGIGEIARRLARAFAIVRQVGEGPGRITLVEALAAGLDIYADDVRTPIYEGLVARGMAAPEATRIVRQEIDDRGLRGLIDNVSVALLVLVGALEAPEDDEDPPGEERAGETPPNRSTLETSTETAPSSV